MALDFVPEEYILRLFLHLSSTAQDEQLSALASYVYDTWVDSSLWPPSAWCVFMQSLRTNNNVEGWHHRLNIRAGRGQIQFYMLVRLLHQESEYVEVQTTLVRGNQCSCIQRKEYRRVNEGMNKLWDELNQGAITSCQLLSRVAKIYGPKEESDVSPEEDRHC